MARLRKSWGDYTVSLFSIEIDHQYYSTFSMKMSQNEMFFADRDFKSKVRVPNCLSGFVLL